MPRVSESELVCSVCNRSAKLPFCCGKTMENDEQEFFCQTCGKETKFPQCCETKMLIRMKVTDLKKHIFGQL
jgi:hypothetical protein